MHEIVTACVNDVKSAYFELCQSYLKVSFWLQQNENFSTNYLRRKEFSICKKTNKTKDSCYNFIEIYEKIIAKHKYIYICGVMYFCQS